MKALSQYRRFAVVTMFLSFGAFCGPGQHFLLPGEKLIPGQSITSPRGSFYLTLQTDGNLVLYHQDTSAQWATNTHGRRAKELIMQADGNLVLYGFNEVLWASNTDGKRGAMLILEGIGESMFIYYHMEPIWSRNRGRHY